MLRFTRAVDRIEHRAFADLPGLLRRGDVLIFNDSRVLPARFWLRKASGGLLEALYLGVGAAGEWHVLARGLGSAKLPLELRLDGETGIPARITKKLGQGRCLLRVDSGESPSDLLGRIGRMPMPPYIRRQRDDQAQDALDRSRYQTVYARHDGSVAAPTAGLHFTEPLLASLDAAGIERHPITLHVGLGTFRPVTASRLADHDMHEEQYALPAETADAINRAHAEGRRVIAVGTTVTRVLESQDAGELRARDGSTRLLIYPPYRWKHVDALLTNFHLPRSTLLALVAALVGLDRLHDIYTEAVRLKYRFFSYGDCMLVD